MLLLASTVLATGLSTPVASADTVSLRVHDAQGSRIGFKAFRAREANGHGGAGLNDQLVDPETLSPIAGGPLYSVGGDPGFDWPGRPAALALAWPTSKDGYANLIVDIPGPGRHELTLLAARQAVAELRGTPGPRSRLAATARALLQRAERAPSERRRGALATQSLDAAHRAIVRQLTAAGRRRTGGGRQWGVTFDAVPRSTTPYERVRRLFGRDGWIRFVVDPGTTPRDLAPAIATAHRRGLKVLVELLDSSERLSRPAFEERVRTFVGALPDADAFEVGNEIQLDPDGAAKVAFAARYVKEHAPRARTLLTLYWQLGEDEPEHSTFAWLDRHARVLEHVDDVGLSVYPDQHPLGASLQRVMTTLHERLPGKRLLISELGYRTPDGEHVWPWGSRSRVARFYQAASMAWPFSGGGAYWWYFLQAPADVRRALGSVYR